MIAQLRSARALAHSAGALLSLAFVSSLNAQCPVEWTLASSGVPTVPGDPPIRQNHAAVFDAARNVVVMFGGFRGGVGSYLDTWTWNGSAWTDTFAQGPAARSVHAMAYDSARQRVVLFGGSSGGALGDTWEWDGTMWTLMNPPNSPAARFNHAMAFDSVRNVVVLTAGFSTLRHNDTWEYDGITWTQRNEPGFTNLTGRNGHGMAFDAGRNRMVVFGGFNGTRMNDTWEMGPTGWVQIPAAGPSGRQYIGGLAYNPDQQLIYLFGGQTGPGGEDRANDLWTWNGTTWTRVHDGTPLPQPVPSTEPYRRDQHVTVYDAARKRLVIFGGYQGATTGGVVGDTWTTGCPTAPCYANCDGSTAEPILNIDDFTCFINEFAAGLSLPPAQQTSHYSNCDASTTAPVLNIDDFTCFINAFAMGCP